MPISDDIVFRHRLERRPEFADGETERAQTRNERAILHLCRIATARMLDRLRQKIAARDGKLAAKAGS